MWGLKDWRTNLTTSQTLFVAWSYSNKLHVPKRSVRLHKPTSAWCPSTNPTTLLSFFTPTMAPLLYPLPTNPSLKELGSRLGSFMPPTRAKNNKELSRQACLIYGSPMPLNHKWIPRSSNGSVHTWTLTPYTSAIRLTSGIGCLFTHAYYLVYLSVYVQKTNDKSL